GACASMPVSPRRSRRQPSRAGRTLRGLGADRIARASRRSPNLLRAAGPCCARTGGKNHPESAEIATFHPNLGEDRGSSLLSPKAGFKSGHWFHPQPSAPGRAARAPSTSEATMLKHILIEAVIPSVDSGRYPAKRVVGEACVVEADIFRDGQALLRAVVK